MVEGLRSIAALFSLRHRFKLYYPTAQYIKYLTRINPQGFVLVRRIMLILIYFVFLREAIDLTECDEASAGVGDWNC